MSVYQTAYNYTMCSIFARLPFSDCLSNSCLVNCSLILAIGLVALLRGAVAQWSEHLQLKQEALGSIPSGCPGFFLFQLAYTNVNGMKLWYSSAAINTDMNGAKDLWCSSTVWLLSTQM